MFGRGSKALNLLVLWVALEHLGYQPLLIYPEQGGNLPLGRITINYTYLVE